MDYIVSQTVGYGNTINTRYCSMKVAIKFNYKVPSYVCGNRIELNRFLDNFALVQDNEYTAIYEARYEMAQVYYDKINNSYELRVLRKDYKAKDFNELIVHMNSLNIGWNEKGN